ncbi:MAG: NusG domain II-containing protein [Butyricicoccus sp.]|nr:NusG domain II-containing protein [Butyricicoccus sp.]
MRLPVKWGDCVIIVLVLALAFAVALPFYLRPNDTLTCEIVQDGEIIQKIALTDTVHETVTIEGAVTNHIEITAEGVHFLESSCPDQVCVRSGLLTRAGQSAVCLPNRVIVRLTGAAAPEVDAVIR